MARDTRKAHGAAGKKDLLLFDPEDVKLVTDEKHHLYDARVHDEPDEAFIAGCDHRGVVEPIIVSKDPETGETLCEDGRKRVKGLRIANRRRKKRGEVPWRIEAKVVRGKAGDAMGRMVMLNEHRTADTPLNKAHKASRMLELGLTEEEVARDFGVSVSTIHNLIKILDAPAAVRNAVEAGKISVSAGYKLARLDAPEAKKKVEQLVEHAPRTPGKKRSKNAKKAREIVDGPKKVAKTKGNGSTHVNGVGGMRAENVVENVKRELEEQDIKGAGGSSLTRGAIVALQWVLGDDKALHALGLS